MKIIKWFTKQQFFYMYRKIYYKLFYTYRRPDSKRIQFTKQHNKSNYFNFYKHSPRIK